MDEKILAMYGLGTDVLKAIGHTDNPPAKRSDADVITTGLVAMRCLRGTFEAARALLRMPPYLPHRLSRRRFNRRWPRLKHGRLTLVELLGHTGKPLKTAAVYSMDRLPMTACDHDRIPRAQLARHQDYRGDIAGKQRDFSGLKRHLLVTTDGQPVECCLTPGSFRDVRARNTFQCDGPKGRDVYADNAYHADEIAAVLGEAAAIPLSPMRKKKSPRAVPPSSTSVQHDHRKRIDPVGSLMERMLPTTIHAVTAEGFELTVFLFVLAYRLNCL
jgi:hypothetical protein